MTDKNDTIHGNAQVFDFGVARAARQAGKPPADDAKRVSFSINIVEWPIDDVNWLADRMDDMGGNVVADRLRQVVREAEAAVS